MAGDSSRGRKEVPGREPGKSRGIGDLDFMAQYGFKYGERDGIRGFYQNGPEDTEGARYTMDDLKM